MSKKEIMGTGRAGHLVVKAAFAESQASKPKEAEEKGDGAIVNITKKIKHIRRKLTQRTSHPYESD